jgi:hypothetical protein
MYLHRQDRNKQHPLMMVSASRDQISHTGIYDDELLCGECDNFIGRYFDVYGKKIFINSKLENYGLERNIYFDKCRY